MKAQALVTIAFLLLATGYAYGPIADAAGRRMWAPQGTVPYWSGETLGYSKAFNYTSDILYAPAFAGDGSRLTNLPAGGGGITMQQYHDNATQEFQPKGTYVLQSDLTEGYYNKGYINDNLAYKSDLDTWSRGNLSGYVSHAQLDENTSRIMNGTLAFDSSSGVSFLSNGTFCSYADTNIGYSGQNINNANYLQAYPWAVNYGYTFDQLSIYVSTANSTVNCTFGIYNSTFAGGTWYPDRLVVNASNINMGTVGQKNATGIGPLSFKNNSLYWGTIWCNLTGGSGAGQLQVYGFAGSSMPYIMGSGRDIIKASPNTVYAKNSAYAYNGTMPQTFPAGATATAYNPLAIFARARTDLAGTPI